MTMFVLENYVDPNGKEPIKIWLQSLASVERKRILMRFRRVENGNFGDYKQINKRLFELRFDFGPGYRIYYTIKKQTIVFLISGGDKKTQKKDILKADSILKEIENVQKQ